MKIRTLPFFLATLLLLASCNAYQPAMVELTPETTDEEYDMGKQVVRLEKDGIEVESTFLQSTPYDLLFQVNITNKSTDELRIQPERFQYFALDPNGDVFAERFAFHPDDIVFELESSIEQDRKAAKTSNALGWVFFGLNAIAATVSLSNDNPELATDQFIDAGINLAVSQIERSEIKKHIVQLEVEKQFYENSAIRDTVISYGESIEGLVIYPRFDEAPQLLFEFDLADRLFEITYDQDWRRP